MAKLISSPTLIRASGNPPKVIEEFVGNVNNGNREVSIARMKSPAGWIEPGQTPEFDEYTIVLRGTLRVATRTGSFEVTEGQAVLASRGEWIQYSSPSEPGAEYISVCLPAFSIDTVHRDPAAK